MRTCMERFVENRRRGRNLQYRKDDQKYNNKTIRMKTTKRGRINKQINKWQGKEKSQNDKYENRIH